MRRVRARPRKCFLIGSLVVGVAGREHHAFKAELHHVVEEGADGFGIGAVEQRGVGGDAEAEAEGFLDGVDGDVVSTFAADGEVVLFALAIEVDAEGQVLAGLEEMNLFFQQQGVGAEINIFLARDQAFHDLADLRVHERLAAGDGDHRCAAFVHGAETFFRVRSFFKMWAGYWILPHPAQARLQRNRGSSMSTSGYCLRPASFCFRT
jgi:hypothetical protein